MSNQNLIGLRNNVIAIHFKLPARVLLGLISFNLATQEAEIWLAKKQQQTHTAKTLHDGDEIEW